MSARRCVLAGRDGHVCTSRPQWHHPVKQQRIRDRFPRGAWRVRGDAIWIPIGKFDKEASEYVELITLARILRDPRNRVWACWAAHQKIEGDHSYLPHDAWEFALEFGLAAQLENDIARQRG